MAAESTGSGCAKALGIGCLVAIGLVATGIAGVWLNRDALRQTPWVRSLVSHVEDARGEGKLMVALRSSLAVRFPAEQVQLQAQVRAGSGKAHHKLHVGFVNPKFPLADDARAQEQLAREIARVVAGSYPKIDRYDQVHVAFLARAGGNVRFTRATGFDFDVAELRGPAPPNP